MTSSKKDTSNMEKYTYSHRRNNLYQHQYNDHHKPPIRRNRRNSNEKYVQNARSRNTIMYSGLWDAKMTTTLAVVKEDHTLKKRRPPHHPRRTRLYANFGTAIPPSYRNFSNW